MQLHALDASQKIIPARAANKQTDYFCLECRSTVRLRFGTRKQPHFFHTGSHRSCRQSGKTMPHIQTQLYLKKQLPENDCSLEHRFPSIDRIADAVWLSKKIVFEVQCSSISVEEILQRNQDYSMAGYSVVWILHEKRFNKKSLSPAEECLISCPFYYTNMDENGNGCIYDQFYVLKDRKKTKVRGPLQIHTGKILPSMPSEELPQFVRLRNFPYCFEGDVLDRCRKNAHILSALLKLESQVQNNRKTLTEKMKKICQKFLIDPYLSLFRMLLENACR